MREQCEYCKVKWASRIYWDLQQPPYPNYACAACAKEEYNRAGGDAVTALPATVPQPEDWRALRGSLKIYKGR